MTIVVTRTNAQIIRTSGTKLVKGGAATQTVRRDTTKIVKAIVSSRVIRAAYGIPGPAGQGIPAGGTTGQVLAKASGDDYDTEWVAQSGGGGGGEANTASNLGAGQGIYKQKSSVDLQFRSLGVSGASTIALVGDVITFSVDGSLLTGIPQSGVTGLETALGLKANTADLGDAAFLDVGTGIGTVAAGNDARFTDQRTPLDGSVTDAKISGTLSQSKITNLETDLAGKVPVTRTINGYDLSANRTLNAADVGADASGTASSAVSTHAAVTSGVHGITAYTETLIAAVSDSAARTVLGLGGAAVLNVGTGSGTVAAGDHTHTSSAITDFASAVNAIISSSSIAITDTFVVASEAAMLALSSAEKGDIAVRTDTNTTYILSGTDPSDLGDWTLLRTPTDTVLSVNGLTGTVVLTTANIADSTNARYVTDADLVNIGNLSGTNTGDQTITLTGDVTGSGTGSFATTIAAGVVANSMLATMGANTIKGSITGSGAPVDLTASQVRTLLSLVPGTDVQAWDATLAAWAAFNSNGMLVQTAADTFAARTLMGTTNEIDVTNGDGVSGNPTFALAATVDLTGHTLNVRDSTFSIKDNADPTKILQFQLSGISAGTTRTLTAPDASGTILVDGNIGSTVQAYNATLASLAGGTPLPVINGGTGASAASTARSNLGLTIGVDVAAATHTHAQSDITFSADLAQVVALAGYGPGIVVKTTSTAWGLRQIQGTTGQITVTNGLGGSGDPTISIDDGAITDAKIRDSAGLSVIGRSANSHGDVADITAANDGEVLRRSGTAIGFGTIVTAGIADDAVTYAKIQDVSATDRILGRSSSGAGIVEEIACTAAGRALIDDADSTAQRTTLGLGSIATQAASSVAITGGSITGIKSFRGMIHGLTLSNNATDATNDIDIAAGVAWDNTNDVLLDLTSAYTKRLDASWTVGTNQGGLDTGSKANSTWYHVWLIRRSDTGVVDVLFSTSVSSPTMPTNYNQKRRIGSIYVQSSGVIAPFEQVEDRFTLKPAISIVNTTAPPTTPTNLTILSPPGIQCRAIVTIAVSSGSGNKLYRVGTVTATYDIDTYVIGTGSMNYVVVDVMTNTSSQIVHYANTASSITCYLNSNGWYDTRGRGA